MWCQDTSLDKLFVGVFVQPFVCINSFVFFRSKVFVWVCRTVGVVLSALFFRVFRTVTQEPAGDIEKIFVGC